MRHTIVLLIVYIFLIIPSCKRTPTQPSNVDSIAYFPNKIGNTWIYSFYDSLSHQSDTVTVLIVGKTTIPQNKPATIWQRTFRSYIDTVFVTVSSDTVRIIHKENVNSQWINTKYVFPLYVGQFWQSDYLRGTSNVVENSSFTVVAGTFVNTFRIEESWGGLNDYGAVSTWFVPKVGVIKMHRRTWGFDVSNELWELMDYHILP